MRWIPAVIVTLFSLWAAYELALSWQAIAMAVFTSATALMVTWDLTRPTELVAMPRAALLQQYRRRVRAVSR